MSRSCTYRAVLRELPGGWEEYLAANSGLPGPRGNIELAQAVAEEGSPELLRSYSRAPDEFLAVCGTVGLGRLLAEGDGDAEAELHTLACDERWRVREAVAMALQRLGDADLERMLDVVEKWAVDPSLLVQRAAIAGACEPRLLQDAGVTHRVLVVLDVATGALARCPDGDQRSEPFRVLRQALAYCWSVVVAAAPEEGFAHFEAWARTPGKHVRWVVRKNLTKARMRRADPQRCLALDSLVRD